MEWLQTILWVVFVAFGGIGSLIGGWCVALLRAAVSELVAIKTAMHKTQGDLSDVSATVNTHSKTLGEHADLHRQHLENFGRLGIRHVPPGSSGKAG